MLESVLVEVADFEKKSSNSEKDGKYSESNNHWSPPYAKKGEQVDVMKVSGLIATWQPLRNCHMILTALAFTS